MTGGELLAKLKKTANARGATYRFEKKRGKGSHGTIYFGEMKAVIPDRKKEIKSGTLHGILKQLGLTLEDLQD